MRIPHSSPSHRMNLRKRPRDECASNEDDRKLSESVDVNVCQCRVFSRHGCSEERFLPTKEWVSQQVQWMTRNVHLLEEVVKEVFTDKKDRREEDEEEKRSSPLSLCFWFRGYVGCHICS